MYNLDIVETVWSKTGLSVLTKLVGMLEVTVLEVPDDPEGEGAPQAGHHHQPDDRVHDGLGKWYFCKNAIFLENHRERMISGPVDFRFGFGFLKNNTIYLSNIIWPQLVGQCHEIFDLFWLKRFDLGPIWTAKTVSQTFSFSRRNSIAKFKKSADTRFFL